MSRPRRDREGHEYIDRPADEAELEASLDHVTAVNRWLGGTRALLQALRPRLPASGEVSILDGGTGTADIPILLAHLGRRRRQPIHVVATDLHPQTVRIAARRTRAERSVQVCRADVLRLPFGDGAFDFSLLTLTLHHLSDAHQAVALRELARVTRRAVLVGELERAWPHYAGAQLLAHTLWRRNPLTRHDAPVSVLRGYAPAELLQRAHDAGLRTAHVVRRFFYRLVLVIDVEDPAARKIGTTSGSREGGY